VFALLCITAATCVAGKRHIVFSNLYPEGDLGPAEVRSIAQDRGGFMWFGTSNGLIRYDGYEFIRPASLQHDEINVVFRDSRDWIWVGTQNRGLVRFNRHQLREQSEFSDAVKSYGKGQIHDSITCVLEDVELNLWVGTSAGLNQLVLNDDQSVRKINLIPVEDANGLRADREPISALFQDADDQLWVGSADGRLGRYHPGKVVVAHQWDSPNRINSICQDPVSNAGFADMEVGETLLIDLLMATSGSGVLRYNALTQLAKPMAGDQPGKDINLLHVDGHRQLWVTTRTGLSLRYTKTGEWSTCSHEPGDAASLVSDCLDTIYEDKDNVLWIGSLRGGISRFNLNQNWFGHYRNIPGAPTSLSDNPVQSIDASPERGGRVWIGTQNGLNAFDPETGEHKPYRHVPGNSHTLSDDYVSAICRDRNGILWLGTKGGGLNRFDPESEQFIAYRNDPNDPASLPQDSISVVREGNRGQLWVGTAGAGLSAMNTQTGAFSHYRSAPSSASSLPHDAISDVLPDSRGRLWIGTRGGGLSRFDFDHHRIVQVRIEPEGVEADNLETATITTVQEDRNHHLWIGTKRQGLVFFDPDDRISRRYTTLNSRLPHNHVCGIIEDDDGKIWISTRGGGLAQLDPSKDTFRIFDESDGIQSMFFHELACGKDASGSLYFGGPNGFDVIDPTNLPFEKLPQSPILTGLEFFGKPVVPGRDNPVLSRPLAATQLFELPFDKRNRMSIKFSTLDFTTQVQSLFRFRMLGWEDDWNSAQESQMATYTGLEPGEYKFEVQASLDGEIWSPTPATVGFKITPPWYQTLLFRLSAGAVSIFCLSGLILWRKHPVRTTKTKQIEDSK
jgi:ligand-binding sensor domain-containing protein